MSSNASLIILTPNTNIRGIIAVIDFIGLIIGMLWIMAVNKKYIFAQRENWYNNPFGIKVKILYFVVDIVLSCKLNIEFFILSFI